MKCKICRGVVGSNVNPEIRRVYLKGKKMKLVINEEKTDGVEFWLGISGLGEETEEIKINERVVVRYKKLMCSYCYSEIGKYFTLVPSHLGFLLRKYSFDWNRVRLRIVKKSETPKFRVDGKDKEIKDLAVREEALLISITEKMAMFKKKLGRSKHKVKKYMRARGLV